MAENAVTHDDLRANREAGDADVSDLKPGGWGDSQVLELEGSNDSDDTLASVYPEQVPGESARRAFIHVALGLVVGAGLLGAYVWHAGRAHKANLLVVEARPLVENADVRSLFQARDYYRQALAIDSSNEIALSGMAYLEALLWVHHGLKDSQAAAERHTLAAASEGIERAEGYAAQALLAVGRGDYVKAEEIAATLAKRGGVSEEIFFALGVAQQLQGELKEARDNLRRAQDLNSSSALYAAALGDAYDIDADAPNANLYWRMAEKNNSAYVLGDARSVVARSRSGEFKDMADAELKRLEGLKAGDLGTHNEAAIAHARGILLYRQGHLKAAEQEAERALELAGRTPMYLELYGRLLLAQGADEKAQTVLRDAASLPTGGARAAYAYIDALSSAGKTEQALRYLDSAAPIAERKDGQFFTTRGRLLLQLDRMDEAKRALEQALAVAPEHAPAVVLLGRLAAKHNPSLASQYFEKAAAIDGDLPEVYESVGHMWVGQRAFADAQRQLATAEEMLRRRGADVIELRAFFSRALDSFRSAKAPAQYLRHWENKRSG